MEFCESSPPRLEWPFPLVRSGPDRDVFDLEDHLLVVATDRLMAHGRALRERIPLKGRVLSRLARFWFRATRDILPNAMVPLSAHGVPGALVPFWPAWAERSTLLRKTRPCAVRCAVHGCLTGAAFEEYEACGSVSSTRLPPKLRRGVRLSRPLFIPFLEGDHGQRRSLSLPELADLVGIRAAQELRERSGALFLRGYRFAWEREIILADAEFSFGWAADGGLVLADEALTPGTARYWSIHAWRPDAEPVRMDQADLLGYLHADLRWDGTAPVPALPDRVVDAIRSGYLDLAGRFGVTP